MEIELKTYLSHLECTNCGRTYSAEEIHTTCPACGKVLYARYDLAAARKNFRKDDLLKRAGNMWRWFELMPVRDENNIVTLGEGYTPLLPARALGKPFGATRLYIKEEGLNPTGSFKARGLSAAVSKAKELGVRAIGMPSAGNAGAALAAYGARAGMTIYIFVPEDTPEVMKRESFVYGAHVYLVKGLIHDAGKIVRDNAAARGWFDVSTLKEPYRAEGKKTMGFEIAEQFDWELPDAILYPTGGGTGIVGMWKAFEELQALGWIGSERPKMICVQAEGCAPIVKAFHDGARHAEPWHDAHTLAPGIRVPSAIADYLMLDAMRASGGTGVTVSDQEIIAAMYEMARAEGIFAAPEGAATYAGYKKLIESGFLKPEEKVVLFNTGSGLKTPELVRADYTVLDPADPELSSKIA
ncbi:MAG: threonine synthase [Chloroflexota bacterium]|nr:threonine synthase [Chloroflexota bacterium]